MHFHHYISKLHLFVQSKIPVLITFVVVLLVLEMIMSVGVSAPVFWALIGSLAIIEFYFSSIIWAMFSAKSHYSFMRFLGHLSAFSFLTIFVFGFLFSEFPSATDYMWDTISQGKVGGLDNSFYFSGITFLSIGYGDISPHGFFRVISLIEGFIGNFIVVAFFSLGISQIFMKVKHQIRDEEKHLEADIDDIEEGLEQAEKDVKKIKKMMK